MIDGTGVLLKDPAPGYGAAPAAPLTPPKPALPALTHQEKTRSPITRFIAIRRFWTVLVFGVGLILGGFWLESALPRINIIFSNLSTQPTATHKSATATKPSPPVATPGATGTPDAETEHGLTATGNEGGHNLPFGAVIVLLLKELGVACLVAGIIGMIIERQAREHESRRAGELQLQVASNAVFALFGLALDKEFVQAVVDTNLKANIVRRGLKMIYSLRRLTADEAAVVNPKDPADAVKRFVMLEMQQEYSFQNVSSAPQEMAVPLAVAHRRGSGARSVTKATFVAFDDKPLDDALIAKAIDPALSSDSFLHYSWKKKLKPLERISIVSNVSSLKEVSDNEVWGSFFPTMGDVELSLRVLPGMHFDVRPLSNGALVEKVTVPEPGMKTWILAGPLLRHNSVVFWWRDPADEGDGAPPAPSKGELIEKSARNTHLAV